MKNLCFLLALAATLPAFSQSTVFAPKGAVWHQTPYRIDCNPAIGLFTYTADEDTLIDGWNARAIHCNEVTFFKTTRIDSLTRFVAVQGDKVFWRVKGQFVLLFDFGAAAGDTITSAIVENGIDDGCADADAPFQYRIDSVSTTEVNGYTLRVQFVSNLWPYHWGMGFPNGQIIERFGVMNLTHWYGIGHACVLAGCWSFIRCYADAEVDYVNPKWASTNKPCHFTAAATEPTAEVLTISPNPASGLVELPFEPKEIRLANALGQVVQLSAVGRSIDVGGLEAGVWFLFLKKGERWLGSRLVVQRP